MHPHTVFHIIDLIVSENLIVIPDPLQGIQRSYNILLFFHAECDMSSILDSLVAPLSVINALLVALCMKKQQDVVRTLDTLERIWDDYQVFGNDEIDYMEDGVRMHYANLGETDE